MKKNQDYQEMKKKHLSIKGLNWDKKIQEKN